MHQPNPPSVKIYTLKTPYSPLVAGLSGSGKTEFVKTLIPNALLNPPERTRIVWLYSEWQSEHTSLQHKVTFVYDNPNDDEVLVSNTQKRHMLDFGDVMICNVMCWSLVMLWFC